MSVYTFQNTVFFDNFDGDYSNKLFRSSVKKFELKVENPCLSIKFPFNLPETYIVDNQRIVIPPKHYCVINPRDEVCFLSDHTDTAEAISLFFSDELLKEVYNEMHGSEPRLEPFNHGEYISPLFFEKNTPIHFGNLGKLLGQLQHTNDLYTKSKNLFYTLAENLILDQNPHLANISKIIAAKRSTRMETYRRLDLAKSYIHDNIEANLSISDIARLIYVSEFGFIRHFQEVYGYSPYQYILKEKIERAKDLLKNEKCLISDVAERLNFSDISSFGKCFRKWTGKTPSEFKY